MLTGASQESGIGVWVSAAELWLSPVSTFPASTEIGATLATPSATSTIEQRSDFCVREQRHKLTATPARKIVTTERYVVRDDLIAWRN